MADLLLFIHFFTLHQSARASFPSQPQPLRNFSSSITSFAVAGVPSCKALSFTTSPVNRSHSGTFPPRSLRSLWRRFLRSKHCHSLLPQSTAAPPELFLLAHCVRCGGGSFVPRLTGEVVLQHFSQRKTGVVTKLAWL